MSKFDRFTISIMSSNYSKDNDKEVDESESDDSEFTFTIDCKQLNYSIRTKDKNNSRLIVYHFQQNSSIFF